MKKKFGALAILLSVAAVVQAQEEVGEITRDNGIFNHMDVGVNVGTLGIGIDVAVPVGDYVRIRAGYNFMPKFSLHSNFNVETSNGGKASSFMSKFTKINQYLSEYGIDLNQPEFKEEKELLEQFQNGKLEPKDDVSASMKPNLHQFKFLVDVMPFEYNRHWSFTAGFFVGPSVVGTARNSDKETAILKAVNLYNSRYYRDYVLNDMSFRFTDENGEHNAEITPLTDFVTRNGLAGFTLGTFKSDGRKALMLPGQDATARAEMKVSKIRPYLGLGYNTHISRDRKWRLNVDAGVLFLCGTPSVYVDNVYKIDDSPLVLDEDYNWVSGFGVDEEWGRFYGDIVRNYVDPATGDERYIEVTPAEKVDHVDLVRDLDEIPGKVGSMVNTISKFKVFPNASVTFTYRLY